RCGGVRSRPRARSGAERSRTAVAPPNAGGTCRRRSSAASPGAATRARHAPNGTIHHRRPLATAGKDREAGGGNQGQPRGPDEPIASIDDLKSRRDGAAGKGLGPLLLPLHVVYAQTGA